MNNWMDILIEAVVAGVMGYTWSQILTRDGMVFGWWPNWINRAFSRTPTPDSMGIALPAKPAPNYLTKPLYDCPACVAGFWYALFLIATGVWSGFALAMIPQLFIAIFTADTLARKI